MNPSHGFFPGVPVSRATRASKYHGLRQRSICSRLHCIVADRSCYSYARRLLPRRSEASRQEQPQPVSTTRLSSSKYATETFLFSFHFIVLSNGPNALSRRQLLPWQTSSH